MNSMYGIKLGDYDLAIADLTDYYSLGKMITRVNVPRNYRGLGHGCTLMKKITDDADREGVSLFLEISPSDGLDFNQLEAWYGRAGFKSWHGIYKRKPRKLALL